MKTFRRFLIACVVALLATATLEWADNVKALNPFGQTQAQVAEHHEVNLGDCLLGRTDESWPASYRAICADLAKGGDGPPEIFQEPSPETPNIDTRDATPLSATKTPLKEQVAKAHPKPALEKPASLKLASVKPDAIIKPDDATPTCVIDERGATTLQKKGSPRVLPPQLARLKAGGTAQPGVALVVESACTVASPVDGKVMYAGDFKGYRGIVIIRLKSGQQLIVAGLDRIDVARGKRVTRGTHLGATSSELAPALASAYGPARDNTLLYFDLRNAKGAGEKLNWLPQAG